MYNETFPKSYFQSEFCLGCRRREEGWAAWSERSGAGWSIYGGGISYGIEGLNVRNLLKSKTCNRTRFFPLHLRISTLSFFRFICCSWLLSSFCFVSSIESRISWITILFYLSIFKHEIHLLFLRRTREDNNVSESLSQRERGGSEKRGEAKTFCYVLSKGSRSSPRLADTNTFQALSSSQRTKIQKQQKVQLKTRSNPVVLILPSLFLDLKGQRHRHVRAK